MKTAPASRNSKGLLRPYRSRDRVSLSSSRSGQPEPPARPDELHLRERMDQSRVGFEYGILEYGIWAVPAPTTRLLPPRVRAGHEPCPGVSDSHPRRTASAPAWKRESTPSSTSSSPSFIRTASATTLRGSWRSARPSPAHQQVEQLGPGAPVPWLPQLRPSDPVAHSLLVPLPARRDDPRLPDEQGRPGRSTPGLRDDHRLLAVDGQVARNVRLAAGPARRRPPAVRFRPGAAWCRPRSGRAPATAVRAHRRRPGRRPGRWAPATGPVAGRASHRRC